MSEQKYIIVFNSVPELGQLAVTASQHSDLYWWLLPTCQDTPDYLEIG